MFMKWLLVSFLVFRKRLQAKAQHKTINLIENGFSHMGLLESF